MKLVRQTREWIAGEVESGPLVVGGDGEVEQLVVALARESGQSSTTQHGIDDEAGDALRAAGFDTPIVVTGGIHGFTQAEELLTSDKADIVGFARQSLADPDWFLKVLLGRGDEVVVCEYTNYCEALDQKHVPVTCKLWDRKNRDEPDIQLTPDGRRRMTAPAWNPDG